MKDTIFKIKTHKTWCGECGKGDAEWFSRDGVWSFCRKCKKTKQYGHEHATVFIQDGIRNKEEVN